MIDIIIVGCLLVVLFGAFISVVTKEFFSFSVIISLGFMITLIGIIEDKTPSALDVYRGKTRLEITSVNGVPTDTVVVWKYKNK